MHASSEGPPIQYPEPLARHYDRDYAAAGRARDVEFYVGLARRAAGPVLEVGCGTGRVSLPMARDGATVAGVDPSPLMREQLLWKLEREPEDVRRRVTVHEGHFRRIPVPGPFALVCSPFRAFQHLLTPEDQLAALVEMRRVLAPDGLLAFDVFDYDAEFAARGEAGMIDCSYEMGGTRVDRHMRASVDPEGRTVTAAFEWRSAGQACGDSARVTLRIVSHAELLDLLQAADLEAEAVLGDFDGSARDPATPRELVVLARRTT